MHWRDETAPFTLHGQQKLGDAGSDFFRAGTRKPKPSVPVRGRKERRFGIGGLS
jgi:hypothetical protein